MGQSDSENTVEAQMQRAVRMLKSGHAGMAVDLLSRLNRQHPDREDLLQLAGRVLSGLGRDGEAESLLRRRFELAPESLEARNDLANVLLQQERAGEALSLLEGALAKPLPGPPDPACWFNLGRAYKALGRTEEAAPPLERALAAQPGHFGALITLGDTYKALGAIEDAADKYREAIAANPASGMAWWSLSNLKSGGFTESEFTELARRAAAGAPTDQQVYFEFALAKSLEERGRYDEAFSHYAAGNRLRRRMAPWNARQFGRWLESLRRAFDAVEPPPRPEPLAAPRPVFIVSLPRSGSTLTEQILAAHSQVTAASELPWLPQLIAAESKSRKAGISGWAARATQDEWLAIGRAYLEKCSHWHRSTPVFTDKLPANFPHTGTILCMLPDALVVNVRRRAMDVCWSNYRQLFVRGSEFAYDLGDLAAYWKDHESHMHHWQERAPRRVLNIDYEYLVRDPETQTRRLLEFLGLPWEEACLRFHEARRAVNTASAAQVRQEINTRGIDHWRLYEKHLEPLREAVDGNARLWERRPRRD